MEEKINIAEILKNKPMGTKLYADAFGELSIEDIYAEGKDELGITLSSKDGDELLFYNNGKYNIYGEPILVPSKSMHDWSKFAWKKGDVLVSEGRGRLHVIFEGFNDDTYTTFKGKHYICNYDDNEDYNEEEYNDYNKEVNERTIEFKKDNDDGAQTYINTIEKRLGGKLNRETLEIEKTQPEFKDGDIVFMKGIKSELFANCIFILKGEYKDGDERAFYYAFYNADDKFTEAEYGNTKVHYSLRSATDSEKQQLFDALAKKGKTWDAEKKAIVDLPKKCEFKAMDWCLMRDKKETWKLCQFSFFDDGDYEAPYNAVGGNWFDECIPYNEETKHLLGTTDEWKGGEG